MGDVRLIVDEVGVFPLNDVWLRVPLRLLPHSHIIPVGGDIVWVIKSNVLTSLLLLLLRFLLLFGVFGLLPPALVTQNQAEHQESQDRRAAAHDSGHGPQGQGDLLGTLTQNTDMPSRTSGFAHSPLRTQHPEAGHHRLTGPPRVGLRAATGEAGVQAWLAAAPILARVGGTVSGRNALVGVPLIDAQ